MSVHIKEKRIDKETGDVVEVIGKVAPNVVIKHGNGKQEQLMESDFLLKYRLPTSPFEVAAIKARKKLDLLDNERQVGISIGAKAERKRIYGLSVDEFLIEKLAYNSENLVIACSPVDNNEVAK